MKGVVIGIGIVIALFLAFHNSSSQTENHIIPEKLSKEVKQKLSEEVTQKLSEEVKQKILSQEKCDPSYPDVCIPTYPPDLDCEEIKFQNFTVLPPDRHGFDRDRDGIGCE